MKISIKVLALLLFVAPLLPGCSEDEFLSLRLDQAALVNFPRTVTIQRAIPFANPDGQTLVLDLYRASEAPDDRPLVVVVHGGSWRSGSRDDVAEFAWDLAAQGYVAASVDYRLVSNDVVFPAPVVDVLSAIDFLRMHALDYGIDPNRVGLMGVSAGAHLVLLAGLMNDLSQLDPSRPAGRPYAVQAIVDVEGPADFTVDPSSVSSDAIRRVERLLGTTEAAAGDLLPLASPVTYVRPDGPAVLVIHGTDDTTVPIDQSRRLVAVLAAAGEPYDFVEVPGMNHIEGGFWGSPWAQSYRPMVLDFLRQRLAP